MKKIYNILIVDDIFVNRLLIREIVKKIGAKCFDAENGKQAIEIFEKEHIDVILMDIEMPVMNGIETTKHIRMNMPASKRAVPIIALTAHNPAIFFTDFKEVGFNQLMTKPYSVSKVLSLIEKVCAR